MKKKISERKIIILLIIIFSIILISLYSIAQKENLRFQDDLIFFKLWSNPQKETIGVVNKETKQYKMKVSKQEITHKKIDLWSTIDARTLVNEKIAPGTKGNFEIILTSNSTLKYKIEFRNKNEKPRNFQFYIEEGETGEIQPKEIKRIPVEWEWKYETNTTENKQDTKDGETIKKYNFEICIIGE